MGENATLAATMLQAALSYENTCRIKHNPMDIMPIRLIMFSLYLTVFTVAVSGNFLVVYVVMNNKRMQTVTNIFICNLAISDLLVNFTSLWLTPMYNYVGHWIWGGWLCHGLPLFQGTSIFISTLTLMAIAMDRYFVIVKNSTSLNINDRMSMNKCVMIVALIWLVSLLLVMPYAVHMKMIFIHEPCNFWVCSEDWSMKRFKSVYGVIVMTLQFVVPFVIIGISYAAIWSFLDRHQMSRETTRETTRKKRLLSMLVTMVVLFAVCWFPFNLLNILRDLKLDSWIRPHFSFVFLIAHLISMTATCWNPILYAWMNDMFREEFAHAIPCMRRKEINGTVGNSRVRMVTDCVPASQRTNCTDRTDSKRESLFSQSLLNDSSSRGPWNKLQKFFCGSGTEKEKDSCSFPLNDKKDTIVTDSNSNDDSCHL